MSVKSQQNHSIRIAIDRIAQQSIAYFKMRSLTKALSAAAAFVLTSQVIAFRPPSQSTICRRTITSSALCATPNEKTAAKNPLLPFDDGFPTIEIEEPPQEDIYKQAISRTILWVGLAAAFGGGLAVLVDPTTSEEFFAGYLVEQSLSVDNLFVFLLLFEYFKVPLSSQDRVLNWGIYGAVVMRAVMIGVGAAALEKFHAILLVFAGILVYSSAKTLIPSDDEEEEEDMNENAIVKFSRNIIDSVDEFDGNKFFTLVDGAKKATPLFICMIALEVSDVVFAVDSIPAVFGVTSVSSMRAFFPSSFRLPSLLSTS